MCRNLHTVEFQADVYVAAFVCKLGLNPKLKVWEDEFTKGRHRVTRVFTQQSVVWKRPPNGHNACSFPSLQSGLAEITYSILQSILRVSWAHIQCIRAPKYSFPLEVAWEVHCFHAMVESYNITDILGKQFRLVCQRNFFFVSAGCND